MKQALKDMREIDSMYHGNRKFSREQLIFFVEVIVASTFDRIQGQIACYDDETYKDTIGTYFDGVIENAGMSLAILYAQLTGNGMSPGDILEYTVLDKEINKYISYCSKYGYSTYVKKHDGQCTPDSRPIAEKIVEKLFADYLK